MKTTESPKANSGSCSLDRLVSLILRKLCGKLVVQGHCHKAYITEYYRIMREAAEREFTEDNKPTLDAFLQECFDEANAALSDARPKAPEIA